MTGPHVIGAATCLGCGCTCDDIEVVLAQSTIIDTRNACALGRRWFGTGAAPARARVNGTDVPLSEAVGAAAALLSKAGRPRVLLGPDVSCETYREVVACADLLRARLDIASPASEIGTTLAIQERGIATATLGEIRNRADVIVFWGVDPSLHYPRYASRYAPGPVGAHLPHGRGSRTVIAVDVGDARGPADADIRFGVAQDAEVDMLVVLVALLGPNNGVGSHLKRTLPSSDSQRAASLLAGHLRDGRYAVIVADTGPGPQHDPGRLHRLLALGHALNGAGRGALSLLRSGGNRSGADAVMTRQTGYPDAVDFATGVPRYRPHASATGAPHDATLFVGSVVPIATAPIDARTDSPTIVIGPQASTGALRQARVVIDTGVAGIHSGGTAVRMDDVPMSLRQVLSGPPDATTICQDLRRCLQQVPA